MWYVDLICGIFFFAWVCVLSACVLRMLWLYCCYLGPLSSHSRDAKRQLRMWCRPVLYVSLSIIHTWLFTLAHTHMLSSNKSNLSPTCDTVKTNTHTHQHILTDSLPSLSSWYKSLIYEQTACYWGYWSFPNENCSFLWIVINKRALSLERSVAVEILKCNFNAASTTNEIPCISIVLGWRQKTQRQISKSG